jgi:dihydropteroate synthase
MGILNVTPDSFSDGGQFLDPAAAIAHAHQMIHQGAQIIDIGGESTRPGSQPVPPTEQLRRILPVVDALAGNCPAVLSIDTTSAQVAQQALEHGADIINDVSAGRFEPRILNVAAQHDAGLVLMHMQGSPATMQSAPSYSDVTAEVADFLAERAQVAVKAGVSRSKIILDPGIGFGKTTDHNLTLLRRLRDLSARAAGGQPPCPLLVGTSRKSFIAHLTAHADQTPAPDQRLFGTAASVAWCIANGAAVVRVHDVKPMAQVLAVIRAIQHAS